MSETSEKICKSTFRFIISEPTNDINKKMFCIVFPIIIQQIIICSSSTCFIKDSSAAKYSSHISHIMVCSSVICFLQFSSDEKYLSQM